MKSISFLLGFLVWHWRSKFKISNFKIKVLLQLGLDFHYPTKIRISCLSLRFKSTNKLQLSASIWLFKYNLNVSSIGSASSFFFNWLFVEKKCEEVSWGEPIRFDSFKVFKCYLNVFLHSFPAHIQSSLDFHILCAWSKWPLPKIYVFINFENLLQSEQGKNLTLRFNTQQVLSSFPNNFVMPTSSKSKFRNIFVLFLFIFLLSTLVVEVFVVCVILFINY